MARSARPAPVTDMPLVELRGHFRTFRITSERGAGWLVCTINGINLADALHEILGERGAYDVRLVIYGHR